MQLYSEPTADADLAPRLEAGEVVAVHPCPFALPEASERDFLCRQRLHSSSNKAICYNPHAGTTGGFVHDLADQPERLTGIMKDFSARAAAWLSRVLPGYATQWRLDRASFHPEEEATRTLRRNARNDLLHLDAFATRPSQGQRLLRLFVNLHPTDPRIWVTSHTFAEVLAKYGRKIGLPGQAAAGWTSVVARKVLGLFQPTTDERTDYDWFMLRLHHFLKNCDEFQERARRRIMSFAPGTAWLAFTDGVCYADLRGQYALEHSYFISPKTLACPELAPAYLLEQACGRPVLPRAA